MSEQSKQPESVDNRLVVGVFAAGWLLRVVVAVLPLRWLMTRNLPDDAYMYWQVARNIVAGNGASLDGVNLTTAYHPLWMLPSIAFMALFDNGGDLPIHAQLVFAGTLDLVTAWLVWKSAKLITGREKLSLLAAAAYLFNPYQLGFVVSGLGDGLNALLLLAYFYLYAKMRSEERDDLKGWIVVGLVAGFSMLARTDSVLFHLVVLFHLLLTHPSKNIVERLRRPVVLGLASSVIVVPWLSYMYLETGHFIQTSGSSQPVANHMLREGWTTAQRVTEMAGNFLRALLWKIPTAAAWGPVLAGAALWALGRKEPRDEERAEIWRKWRGLLLIPVLCLLALIFVHGAIRLSVRQWYLLPSSWAGALWLVLLWRVFGEQLRTGALRAVQVLLVAGFLITFVRVWVIGYYPWQVDMYDLAHQVRTILPKSARPVAGGFNILAMAYYNPNQVMNLDGIGNDAVMADIKKKRLGEYIDESGLQYLVDWDFFIAERYGFFIKTDLTERLVPLAACESEGSTWKWKGPLTLYRILPPGQKADPNVTPAACKRLVD
ncbi:MAG: glycosyltransferase family 39 protein [Chrysiogenetes bacterium]|nr:glycosyltransferase family 39 protein [Chrysiogenetes bacterium]